MALPNPQSKLIDNTGKQVITLGSLLRVQEDVEKWSQNTDINTFRGQVESEKGFNELKKKLGEGGPIAQAVRKDTEETKKLGSSIDDPTDEKSLGDSLARIFRVAIKPLQGLTENLSEVSFRDIGNSMFSVTRGAERVNTGFKELTNGIGEFGPIFNALRTSVFKAVAVINVLTGTLQLITASILNFGKFLLSIPKRIGAGFNSARNSVRNAFSIKDDPQSLAEAEQRFVSSDKGVQDAESALKELTEKGPDKAKITLIEGTPEYYRDMALANQAQKGDMLLGVGNQEQARLNQEFAEQKIAAENNVLEEREKAEKNYKKKFFNFDKNQSRKRNAFEKGLMIKQFAFRSLMFMAKFLLPIALIVGGIAMVVDIFKNKIQEFKDTPLAGIFQGFKTGLTKAAEQAKGLFSKLGSFLTKLGLLPKTTPKPPKPTTPKPGTKPPTATKTATQTLKSVGGQVVKKLPVIGAGVETVMDATSNEKKFARIKDAYENNQPIIPDENGELRPMTAEEFAAAEASMSANRAGSVGRGAGAFGGAAAGAATGAAIGSVIPIVGTAIGGIIGGVLGGFFGGRKGDEIATNLANQAEGIDDPQAYIDMLAANVPELQNEAGAELAGAQGEVADATMANNTGGSMNNQQFNQTDNSSSNTFNGSEIPVSDQQADYSYA